MSQVFKSLLLASTLLSPFATAEMSPFVNLGIGFSTVVDNHKGVSDGSDDAEIRQSFSIGSGIEFDDSVGFQISYLDLGSYNRLKADGLKRADISKTVDVNGIELASIGRMELQRDILYLTGKAGLFLWNADNVKTLVPTADESGQDFFFGFGVRAYLIQGLSVEGGLNYYRVADEGLPNFMITTQYAF